jgi:hypothetical protein
MFTSNGTLYPPYNVRRRAQRDPAHMPVGPKACSRPVRCAVKSDIVAGPLACCTGRNVSGTYKGSTKEHRGGKDMPVLLGGDTPSVVLVACVRRRGRSKGGRSIWSSHRLRASAFVWVRRRLAEQKALSWPVGRFAASHTSCRVWHIHTRRISRNRL